MKLFPKMLQFAQCWFPALLTCVIALTVCASGCSRHAHRKMADREAYRLLKSRQFDQRWTIPDRAVEPDPRSRLADVHDPDCGPVPPDDPASRNYMRQPFNSKKRIDFWDKRGETAAIDSQHWLEHLPYNENGEIVLDKELTVELALMHSREFQTRVEQLYLQALSLSSNRFEFMLNWFGGSDLGFTATDDGFEAERDVSHSNQLGFNRALATGGQLAANMANSFNWSFGGSGSSNFSAGNLAFALTQPLLRGAFRHVRTESLTQSERNLLYAVRDFARFRRQFYLDTVRRYLDILVQSQSVRIEEENVRLLELSVKEHEVRLKRELVSPIQVDQVVQNYQSGRLSLINSKQDLQTALDQFKLRLGLPARISIKIDESFLSPFQLNSPEVEKLDKDVEAFKQSLNQYLPPDEAPLEFLEQALVDYTNLSKQVEMLKPAIEKELNQWLELLEETEPTEMDGEDAKINHNQQSSLASQIKNLLIDLDDQISRANKELEMGLEEAAKQAIERQKKIQEQENEATDQNGATGGQEDQTDEPGVSIFLNDDDSQAVRDWKLLQDAVSKPSGLTDRVATLLVYQTQIRLFLIKIKPLDISQDYAVDLALKNRLDLMNSRAAVTDAFRRVEIAADQLESDLSVQASADLRTDPTRDNAFRLDGDENIYGLGINFDGPLNRLNERNSYRSSQIAYQQQRRAYMADEDSIVNSVRLNIRQLQTNKFSFQIAQQQLITVARQVREAQLNLRRGSGDSSSTQDLLQAFQTLRNTKNRLVSSWIEYETSRISLFVDLELLMLDQRGMWINEQQNFDADTGGRPQFEDQTFGQPDSGFRNQQRGDEPTRAIIDPPVPETSTLDGANSTLGTSWRSGVRNLLGRN